MHLPNELIINIANRLNIRDAYVLSLADKKMHYVVSHHYVCSDLSGSNMDDRMTNSPFIKHVLDRVDAIDLSNTGVTHKTVYYIITRCPAIHTIVVRHCPIQETELVRKLIIYTKKHDIHDVSVEFGPAKKPVRNISSLHPHIRLKRWYCNKHALDIRHFNKTQFLNNPDEVQCHECFCTLPGMTSDFCKICLMITCDRCMTNRACGGCV